MGTKYTFPKAIKPQCHGALNRAKEVCKAAGISIKESSGSVKIITRDGTKKNKNGWSWYDPANKQQVMMLTHGGPKDHAIEIATQPKDITKGWMPDALAHEFCHVFLERNEGNYGHDKRLAGKIFGWK